MHAPTNSLVFESLAGQAGRQEGSSREHLVFRHQAHACMTNTPCSALLDANDLFENRTISPKSGINRN